MLYIQGINESNGTLCVGNTFQGRAEWVTYAETVNAVLLGSYIVGCNYGSIEELRKTRKFKTIDVREEQKSLTVKIGEVKCVRGNTYDMKIYVAKTLDTVGDTFVATDYVETEVMGLDTEAVITGIDYRYDMLKLTTSKGYQCCVRNEQVCFQEIEVGKIRPEVYAYLNKLGEMAKAGQLVDNVAYLRKALDYCQTVVRNMESFQFANAIKQFLKPTLLEAIKKQGFSVEVKGCPAYLYFIHKHEVSLSYKTGNMFSTRTMEGAVVLDRHIQEKSQEYAQLVNKEKKVLPIALPWNPIGMSYSSGIYPADKNNIRKWVYSSMYCFDTGSPWDMVRAKTLASAINACVKA